MVLYYSKGKWGAIVKETLVGYHGTTESNCTLIMKQKKFKFSINQEMLDKSLASHDNTYQWLGEGIYFWHRNKNRASYWAKVISKKTHEYPKVLMVPITYEEDRCFDLGKKEHYKKIKMIIEKLYTEFKKTVNFEQMSRDDKYKFVGAACDFLFCETKMYEKFDLIYAGFMIETDEYRIIDEITPQICVKNDKVIEYSRMKIV